MAIDNRLSMGPLLFNWSPEKARDFYFKIADEAPVDLVYLGESVCSKRLPFHTPYLEEVLKRLKGADKEVILSTLILVSNQKELESIEKVITLASDHDVMVEANDISAVSLLKGKPHAIGPSVNIYNETSLQYFERNGAKRMSLPFELPKVSLGALSSAASSAELEVQVFGRLPLAISARCYHARLHDKSKDQCQFVCDKDRDGLVIDTMDSQPFLTINGLQTLSHTCCNLGAELEDLQQIGIHNFRLSPHDTDMVAVSQVYRNILDGKTHPDQAAEELEDLLLGIAFSNGFYYGDVGMKQMVWE